MLWALGSMHCAALPCGTMCPSRGACPIPPPHVCPLWDHVPERVVSPCRCVVPYITCTPPCGRAQPSAPQLSLFSSHRTCTPPLPLLPQDLCNELFGDAMDMEGFGAMPEQEGALVGGPQEGAGQPLQGMGLLEGLWDAPKEPARRAEGAGLGSEEHGQGQGEKSMGRARAMAEPEPEVVSAPKRLHEQKPKKPAASRATAIPATRGCTRDRNRGDKRGNRGNKRKWAIDVHATSLRWKSKRSCARSSPKVASASSPEAAGSAPTMCPMVQYGLTGLGVAAHQSVGGTLAHHQQHAAAPAASSASFMTHEPPLEAQPAFTPQFDASSWNGTDVQSAAAQAAVAQGRLDEVPTWAVKISLCLIEGVPLLGSAASFQSAAAMGARPNG